MHLPLLTSLPPRWRKILLWSVGLVLFYTVVGFLILPLIIKSVAVSQLSKRLGGREVTIQKVKLNPYVLSLTIRGLLIKDKDGQPFVSWDEVYVNFQLASFFQHPWVFKEVSTTKPFIRVQVNKDYTFNFSDLVTQFSTNAPSKEPPKPLALRIDRLRIAGAAASLTDLTPRTPFERRLGPIDVTLINFQTDPANKNPYSVAGTTDAGERFGWSGYFYLQPLRSQGDFSLENLSLNKYAPLYQDFFRFQIVDGTVDVHTSYHFEITATNKVAWVTNSSMNLHSLKVTESKDGPTLLELPDFKLTGASLDTGAQTASMDSMSGTGARITVRRDKDASINLVESTRPTVGISQSEGVLLMLRAVTNAVTLFLNTTNAWRGTLRDIEFHNCALELHDLANPRPVRLLLDNIDLSAKHISNQPGENMSASASLRWNTNGSIKSDITASLSPVAVDIQLALDKLELHPLDPYLEPRLDLLVLGSKLSMNGHIRMRVTNSELPDISFQGDSHLDDFSTVDGAMGEDLLKWGSVRLSGMEARLNPETVNIKQASVEDAYVRVIIGTNKTINLLTALRMGPTNVAAAPTAKESAAARKKKKEKPEAQVAESSTNSPFASLPKFSIGSVVLSNVNVQFTDRSVSPSVNMTVKEAGGTIDGLSSDQMGHATLKLFAKVDGVGPVEVSGTVNPISPTATNDIKILVKDVDLTPTSPYVGKFAGYHLEEGKLGMELEYHMQGRKLQSENRIVLDRFTFGDKVNSPDATKLPVRLAIAILKDRDGRIKLDVPIEGSLDDPQFRLHKVIISAIENILTKIATSPFSALGAVFGGHGEEIRYQDFDPGSAELQQAGKGKLDSLVKGLYERPGLQLEISGSIDPDADREGLRHRALEKRLRIAKWMSLRKTDQQNISPAQITLTPQERLQYMKELYAGALSTGQLAFTPFKTNVSGQSSTALTPEMAAQLLAEMRPQEAQRGASALMQGSGTKSATPEKPPAGATAQATAPATKPPTVENTVEEALANSFPVTDADLQALAAERCKNVREYILQSGKVEANRLFLAEKTAQGPKTQGCRVYLELR